MEKNNQKTTNTLFNRIMNSVDKTSDKVYSKINWNKYLSIIWYAWMAYYIVVNFIISNISYFFIASWTKVIVFYLLIAWITTIIYFMFDFILKLAMLIFNE